MQFIERWKNRAYRVSVTEIGKKKDTIRLNLEIDGGPVDDEMQGVFVERIEYALDLQRDLTPLHIACSGHSTLNILPKIGAGRVMRSASFAETIVKTICSTNVNWTQAVKMINRLGQLGPPVRHFVNLTAWPTPREILKAGEEYLRDVCRLGYRVPFIMKFCRDVCDGKVDPDDWVRQAADPTVDSDTLLAQLRGMDGIGPSSSHFLLTMLGRFDRLILDSASIPHVARTHFNGRKPSIREIERVYEPYGEWKNLVLWFEHWLNWQTARNLLAEYERNG